MSLGWLASRSHPAPQRCDGTAGIRRPHKAVADILGHSSIAITGDVYGHIRDTAAAAFSACERNNV